MSNRLLYKIFLGVFVVDVLTGVSIPIIIPRGDIGSAVLMLILGVSASLFLGLTIFARFFKKDIYLIVKIIFLIIGAISFLMPWYAILDYTIQEKQRSEHFERIEEAEQQKKLDECRAYKLRAPLESKDGQLIPVPNNIPIPPPGCI